MVGPQQYESVHSKSSMRIWISNYTQWGVTLYRVKVIEVSKDKISLFSQLGCA